MLSFDELNMLLLIVFLITGDESSLILLLSVFLIRTCSGLEQSKWRGVLCKELNLVQGAVLFTIEFEGRNDKLLFWSFGSLNSSSSFFSVSIIWIDSASLLWSGRLTGMSEEGTATDDLHFNYDISGDILQLNQKTI